MVLQRASLGNPAPDASLRNQCYEPAVRAVGRPDSRIGAASGCAGIFDHDFVIKPS